MFSFNKEEPEKIDEFYRDPNYADKVFMYHFHDDDIKKVMMKEQKPLKNKNGGYHYMIYIIPKDEYKEDMTPDELLKYASVGVLFSPYHYIKYLMSIGFSGKIHVVTEQGLQKSNITLERLYYVVNSEHDQMRIAL